MSEFYIAAKSKEEQDKVAVDLVAPGVAGKERFNQPVVAEVVAREQPEHLREYFMQRVTTTVSLVHSCPELLTHGMSKWLKLTGRESDPD